MASMKVKIAVVGAVILLAAVSVPVVMTYTSTPNTPVPVSAANGGKGLATDPVTAPATTLATFPAAVEGPIEVLRNFNKALTGAVDDKCDVWIDLCKERMTRPRLPWTFAIF